jgi:hypothetical protein
MVPALQLKQLLPVEVWNLPTGHNEHLLAPAIANLPLMQLLQLC